MNKQNFDSETLEYFNSLPAFIQENILQSNPNITNKNDLIKIAQNLTRPKDNGANR